MKHKSRIYRRAVRIYEAVAVAVVGERGEKMMLLKACERCGGDLHETEDMYGSYRMCMQCGKMVDLPDGDVRNATKTNRSKQTAASEVAA